jgi:hypothetical protein
MYVAFGDDTVPVQEISRFSVFQHARCSDVRRGRCKVSSLVSRHKYFGVGSLINQHAAAVLTNHVQALVAPITTQANCSPEESRRREFAHLGLDREDRVIKNTTTTPIPTLKCSLASLPPFWRAIAVNSLASETLHLSTVVAWKQQRFIWFLFLSPYTCRSL